jgi:hypothetical protein
MGNGGTHFGDIDCPFEAAWRFVFTAFIPQATMVAETTRAHMRTNWIAAFPLAFICSVSG